MQKKMIKFIKDYSNVSGNENRNIINFIKNFNKYDENKNIVFDNDVFLNKIKNYKNTIYEITKNLSKHY